MSNELHKSDYYNGYLMPDKFSKWLESCPLQWQMMKIEKDSGTYMFFIEDNEDDLDKDLVDFPIKGGL